MEKMWQHTNALHSTSKHINYQPPPTQIQTIPTTPAAAPIKLSRRQLAICTKWSLILLTSQLQDTFHLPKARAQEQNQLTLENPQITLLDDIPIDSNATTEDNPVDTSSTTSPTQENSVEASPTEENPSGTTGSTAENPAASVIEENQSETSSVPNENQVGNDSDTSTTTKADSCIDKVVTKRAFLDISIDGKPIGRIVVGLYGNNVPAGTTKFSDFVSGAAGVSYRRKEFIKITPGYIQHGGVRSYGVDAELAAKTGRNFAVDNLVAELEKENVRCPGTKNTVGSIGIIVRDPLKPPPKQKLVARNGKLVIDEEEIGKEPNGTEFVISTKDSPDLDASTLVIGKILEGIEVVEKIAQVKTVQENTSSPYFRVAKLIGDKRAVVAERGFNRPYSKVVVTNCGLMV
ncbi:hypothetical protein R6Q59_034251 [Mikania micrantha]|uniref:PPIase cyclophilin-type domain-containing protein n=1 Tax=Mikania micrantha TaxID=192012 RepID=A0A5N6NKZ5_9ASTR|nr:hypothetical protein E3N88_20928 [Mikania micrantha]